MIRPTFMGFETATRGLMASQKALDIVGNNLGNIATDGYTRQRVDMVSVSVTSRYSRYAQNMSSFAGQGVAVSGVSQIRDPFLDKRFREEYADVGYYDKMNTVLKDIEAALDEIEPSQISTALSQFETAWSAMLKPDNANAVNSSSLLAAAKNLTQVFQQLDTKLNNVWEQQKFDLEVEVNKVNSIMERIANLNDSIKKEMFSSMNSSSSYYGPNELLDERNVLLDQLSEFGDIQVTKESDGTVTVKMNQQTVIKGDQHDTIKMVQREPYQSVSLTMQSTGEEVGALSGSLKASMEMLNGRGAAAKNDRGETIDKGILFYKDKINAFAGTLAKAFNETVQEKTSGKYKTLFLFDDYANPSAGTMKVYKGWEDNPSYIIDDAQISGSDDNAFVVAALGNFKHAYDFGDGFKGTFNDYVKFYTTANLGNQVEFSESRLTACTDISESLLKSISQISGVSKEEEGVDMMQYSKAYEAMARVMTAMDEALDVLINRTGLVGR